METFVMKKKGEEYQDDPVDQANLDLSFIDAFIDMLGGFARGQGTLDTLRQETVSSMCLESKKRIDSLQRFIAAIPIKTVKEAA